MKQESGDLPIACCLTDAELRRRQATLIAQLGSAVIAVQELPDGFAFQVPGDKSWMTLVAELIAAERECCPFLTFELTAEPNRGPLSIRVKGPAGAKDFLKSLLLKSLSGILGKWSAPSGIK